MFKGLENKSVLVTGGSRGIGKAIVTEFAKAGAKVCFFYVNSAEKANALVDELAGQGYTVQAMKVDVTDKTAVEASVNEWQQISGRVDVLVNNSGIIRDNLLAGLSFEEIKAVIDTNVHGVFNACQAVIPFMMRQRAGAIINISSVSAEKGGRGQTNYAASKGAINALTKSLAVELAPRHIRVNAVAPGVIATDMSQSVRELAEEEVLSHILLKRFGQAEDIANAVAFLASDYANYITGEVLHVDGGFKM